MTTEIDRTSINSYFAGDFRIGENNTALICYDQIVLAIECTGKA